MAEDYPDDDYEGGVPVLAAHEIEQFGSIDDWRPVFGDEDRCRRLFEAWIWPDGAQCPHCGSQKVWRIKPKARTKAQPARRPGLFECGVCNGQFTFTTGTPLHGTKLSLGKWMEAFYLVLGSSKGLSSVVLARQLGVTQPTAWKMGHAIRELLQRRHDLDPMLRNQVEVDTMFLGGAPKPQKHVYHGRGKATLKVPLLLAVERQGEVVAKLVPSEKTVDLAPLMLQFIDRAAEVTTDGDRALIAVAKQFARRHQVNHSAKEWAVDGHHTNTAEAYALQIQRAVMGVYHRISGPHAHRYIDELVFRWNQRQAVIRKPSAKAVTGAKRGKKPGKRTKAGKQQTVIAVRPFEEQMAILLRGATGRQLRWEKTTGGIRWPANEPPRALRNLEAKEAPPKPIDPEDIPF